jgi:hypothetical protein
MKLDWNEKPGGFDLLELRDFMKRNVSNNEYSITRLEGIIFGEQQRAIRQASAPDIPAIRQRIEQDCQQYLQTLLKLEYIQTIPDPNFGDHYMQTLAGTAFAMAGPKRFTRKAAQKQLDEFLRRCRELNSQLPNIENPESICQVDSVIVFGSFAADGTTDVGDVDLCLTLSVRDTHMFHTHIRQAFHSLATAEALQRAPEILALKKLRKGLNILSIGTQLPDGVSGKCLFAKTIGGV